MAATVDLFRMKAGVNGFGRSSAWWSFVQGLQTVVDAELRRLAERFFQRCLKSVYYRQTALSFQLLL